MRLRRSESATEKICASAGRALASSVTCNAEHEDPINVTDHGTEATI